MAEVIGIVSLKGGVGKTSSVISLGESMSKFGKKVLLVDGNFSAPNLGLHLNIINPESSLHSVLSGKSNISDSIIKIGSFDLLPSSIFSKDKISPLKLKSKLGYLRKKYDIIIIDSSPALNDETLAVMLASDKILVVSTPDTPTLSTTLKAVKLAKSRGKPIIGIVLNKVYNKKYELSISNIENISDIPIMAVIPHDTNFLKAISEFKPYSQIKPNSEATYEYDKLAASLLGEKFKPFKLKRFFKWIAPPKQEINRTIFYQRVFK